MGSLGPAAVARILLALLVSGTAARGLSNCETTMSRHFVVKRKVEQGKCVPFLFQQRREHRTCRTWDLGTFQRCGVVRSLLRLHCTHTTTAPRISLSVSITAPPALSHSRTLTHYRARRTHSHTDSHTRTPLCLTSHTRQRSERRLSPPHR